MFTTDHVSDEGILSNVYLLIKDPSAILMPKPFPRRVYLIRIVSTVKGLYTIFTPRPNTF